MSGITTPPQEPPQEPPRSGLAIAGLVLGVASIAMFWSTVFDVIIGGIGIAVSIAGIVATRPQAYRTGRGMAIAGLVLSIVGALIGLSLFIAILALGPQQTGQIGVTA
jgi:VanZ family protein